MKAAVIHIKNMVCARCISAVEKLLKENALYPLEVQLGKATLQNQPDQQQIRQLKQALALAGFELLEDEKKQLAQRIKDILIKEIHYPQENRSYNYSVILSQQLQKDYSYLSTLFRESEGITIEKYIIQQKIERVKELLSYNELTLTEIARQLEYSSVAHLSNQFRQVTGISPSQYRSDQSPGRISLDRI